MKINDFLLCETPPEWTQAALANLDVLLIDHANCEKKAAGAALNLTYKYVDKRAMLLRLSKLAREELRHFEQVLALMARRNVEYVHVSPSRYASALRKPVRTFEPARLTDILIVNAIVEARSCERFGCLIDVLDDELSDFYRSLLESEARHFNVYLSMAGDLCADDRFEARVAHFLEVERELVETPDTDFRFHSGKPQSVASRD